MLQLIIVIILLIAISFLCSILESVLLSISRPYIEQLTRKGSRAGKLLKEMKESIDKPISAILTLNTIAHTAGAALSGAIAHQVFGEEWMALFSAVLTFLILVLSEIIPKTIGANQWKRLSKPTAYILRFMTLVLMPVIIPLNALSRLFASGDESRSISREEVRSFARLGYYQGSLKPSEFLIMDNLLAMQEITIREIMTPRTVVYSLPAEQTVGAVMDQKLDLPFSRMPLTDSKGSIIGIITRRDLIDAALGKSGRKKKLKSLAAEAFFTPESNSVYRLLNALIEERHHLVVVLNEYGDYTGIVTLEDCIETLLGREIVDEYDPMPDMQKLARLKATARKEQTT